MASVHDPSWGIMVHPLLLLLLFIIHVAIQRNTKYLAINWIILLTRETENVFIAIPSARVWCPAVQLLNKFTSHGLSDCLIKQINTATTERACLRWWLGRTTSVEPKNFLHYNPSRGLIPSLWLLRADCVYFVFFFFFSLCLTEL